MKFDSVANLPVSLPVKEFGKSVNIWGSYGQKFGVLFFCFLHYLVKQKNTKIASFHSNAVVYFIRLQQVAA